ncbi:hypothetical protein O6H91_08G028100 [Diphasiastrum complanatum]|uniref:Uncharacterized protein n=1 Tax=Diphasiastrum complanatum TaxID=34168 RepID=A0ACC2CWB2_DIPCM|nr:hypothetical protein O6H91_08G028100 [Diphasiastrum complanatum]
MKGRYFAVDEWSCNRPCYFLTHMHSDHTNGLSPTWHRGPLYCTSISAALLLAKFKGLDPALLHVLEVGVTALIDCPHEDDGSCVPVLLEVTAIDAHHCPGAVMYLFRGEFGCILHTGDFRWDVNINGCSNFSERKEQVEALLGGDRIDYLYLDNTFCNPRYSFPTRFEAAQQVLALINRHPDCDVVIGVDNLGKEELLLFIAATYNTKIWVWPERLLTMRILGLPDVFTTDSTATRIRAVPRYSVSVKTLNMLNRTRQTIAILPTGCFCSCWPVRKSKEESMCSELTTDAVVKSYYAWKMYSNSKALEICDMEKPILEDMRRMSSCSQNHDILEVQESYSSSSVSSLAHTVHVVPYSLHACYAELQAFVQSLRPLSVIGIVQSPSNLDTNPAHHFHRLLRKEESSCSEELEIKDKYAVVNHKFPGTSSYSVPKFSPSAVSHDIINKSSGNFTRKHKPLFRLRQFSARKYGVIRLRRKGGGTKITTFIENAKKKNLV